MGKSKKLRKVSAQKELKRRSRLFRLWTPKETMFRLVLLCPNFIVKILLKALVAYKEWR